MRRRLIVAIIAASLLLPTGALPAQAHPTYCNLGQTVWIKSNMTGGTWRKHHWQTTGGTWKNSGTLSGTGWKYTNTGIQNINDSYYSGNHPSVSNFTAYCVTGPSFAG